MNFKLFFKTKKLTLIIVFILFSIAEIYPCDCSRQNIERGFNSAAIIFEGQILSGDLGIRNLSIAYKVEVFSYFKGNLGKEIMTVYADPASCGYLFEIGKQYIIYADAVPPVNYLFENGEKFEKKATKPNYSVSGCSRTTHFVDYECSNIERFLSNTEEKERERYFFSNESIFIDAFLDVERSIRKQFHKAMRD